MTALTDTGLGSAASMSPVERGILWLVAYSSIFKAPVRFRDLAGRVVGARADQGDVERALGGAFLRERVREDRGFVCLRSEAGLDPIAFALRRAEATARLLDEHREVLSFVRSLPDVRFAALSGGCAHDAADDGDIDVFVVTNRGALWRTLLRATLVSKVRGWRRLLCMNYLVDETAQALPWRDFYGAFELISLKPLTGEAGLSELLRANPWAHPIFPNFVPAGRAGQNPLNQKNVASGETVLEAAARMIQRPYLRYRLPASAGVELSDHVVRLHSTDHRTRLRGLFQDALQRIGMEAPPWI
jgi:hypothetical protein